MTSITWQAQPLTALLAVFPGHVVSGFHDVPLALSATALPEPDSLPAFTLNRFASLQDALADDLVFLSDHRLLATLMLSKARVVLISESCYQHLLQQQEKFSALRDKWFWRVQDAYLGFAKLQQWWVQQSQCLNASASVSASIHPSAVIDPSAVLAEGVEIGPQVVIAAGARIGAHTKIMAGSVIGEAVQIGEHGLVYPRVTIYHDCVIGHRVMVHSGVVIGADGFGYARAPQGKAVFSWEKIPQVGRVVIGDDVEIGANTTIDRGALGDTLIANGVKLDNQIQIGHNCSIGAHTAMAGCTGVAGSTSIGAGCMIGGASMIVGHLSITDGVMLSAGTPVISSIDRPGHYTGLFPITEHRVWEKIAANLRLLPRLREQLRDIQQRLKSQ